MQSPLATAVQDCAAVGIELLEEWSEHASKVAAKLDDGYDADSAAADVAITATLAASSGLRLAFGALDALAVLTGRQCDPHVVTSHPFPTTLPGARLKPAGPFVNGLASDSLPVGVITVDPSALGPNEKEFLLRADVTGHRAGAYRGTVEASTPTQSEAVTAWIIVP